MSAKKTDVSVVSAAIYFLPVTTRVPLKFGPETLTCVTCARAKVTVEDRTGRRADGWGETPLNVQWVWPSSLSYREREAALRDFCVRLTRAWPKAGRRGHPIEIGWAFLEEDLPALLAAANAARAGSEPMPHLAGLVCSSPFDIATHDAYGRLHGVSVYETYNAAYMNADLSVFLSPAEDSTVRFDGRYPADYLVLPRRNRLAAWHLVGGLDPLTASELTGREPQDGRPVLLRDWIRADGLKCLKVKLRGNDAAWDYARLVAVGRIAAEEGADWLTADFNCTVTDPAYVNDMLDRLRDGHPKLYGMILYVEQPFPYDLEKHMIDVHSVAARKPLFMDESCHDWRLIRLGRRLGWNGVALKTCKTQTGAILSLCWARAHGMALMVQDLTNPMLAQIPHCLLAAHAGTIMGVETNAMQFYPDASLPEAEVHGGLYVRRQGCIDLESVRGPGFGYRLEEIRRVLPEPAAVAD